MSLLLGLLLTVGSAFAQADCGPDLSNQTQAHLEEIFLELRQSGRAALVQPFDTGKFSVRFESPRSPRQKPVSARGHTLTVRRLDWNSLEERQQRVEEVAQLLTRMQKPYSRFWVRGAIAAGILTPVILTAPYWLERLPTRHTDPYTVSGSSRPVTQFDRDGNAVRPAAQEILRAQKLDLERKIRLEQDKIYPDLNQLDRFKSEYQALLAQHPWLQQPGAATR